jgi:micrococcal nuclease
MLARVQERVEGRFGFRCGGKTTYTRDAAGNKTVNADRRKRKRGFDIIRTRRSAQGVQVTKVIDGDTIEVREKDRTMQTVRLIGIDTPEVSAYGKKAQCYGKEASLYLKRLLARKNVELIAQPGDNRDKYGRLLRYVHLSGGDIGLWMLNLGYARYYPWFEHPRMKEYKAAEIEAQRNGRGLWVEC